MSTYSAAEGPDQRWERQHQTTGKWLGLSCLPPEPWLLLSFSVQCKHTLKGRYTQITKRLLSHLREKLSPSQSSKLLSDVRWHLEYCKERKMTLRTFFRDFSQQTPGPSEPMREYSRKICVVSCLLHAPHRHHPSPECSRNVAIVNKPDPVHQINLLPPSYVKLSKPNFAVHFPKRPEPSTCTLGSCTVKSVQSMD